MLMQFVFIQFQTTFCNYLKNYRQLSKILIHLIHLHVCADHLRALETHGNTAF